LRCPRLALVTREVGCENRLGTRGSQLVEALEDCARVVVRQAKPLFVQ
jgi:hypothetical protein